jgi:hypothetical protein
VEGNVHSKHTLEVGHGREENALYLLVLGDDYSSGVIKKKIFVCIHTNVSLLVLRGGFAVAFCSLNAKLLAESLNRTPNTDRFFVLSLAARDADGATTKR